MKQNIAFLNPQGDKRLSDADLDTIAGAISQGTAREFEMHWGWSALCCRSTQSAADLTKQGVWPCLFVPTLADKDALAEHTEGVQGPILLVGLDPIFDNGGTLIGLGVSVSSGADHEVKEAGVNAFVDMWCDAYKNNVAQDYEVAREACDPVQSDTYAGASGVALSNFVLPSWFDPDAKSSVDFMNELEEPFSIRPGGYVVTRTGGPSGTSQAIFGAKVPSWKRDLVWKHGRLARHRDRKLFA